LTDEHIRLALLRQRSLFGSQQAMARALGVSEQNLGRFLTGKQGIMTARGRGKLIRALGLEVERVLVLKPKEGI
jgi:DNA-binding transcriptional regulator YdaS (Cro superfamily)